jgi:hypothetical protein
MSTRVRRTGIAALAFTACASLAAAQEGAPAAPPMSPEEQKMMAAMEAAGRPGPEHQWLATATGSWELTATFWMGPGAEPMVSKGTVERTMMLGGRVMAEKVVAEMMGAPFEGHGMAGFDNVSKTYWGTWNDNMMTGLMTSTGTCAAGKCEHTMTANDPVSGQLKQTRMTSEHHPDHEVHVMYDKGPDGAEWKAMELVYTRKK